MINLDLKTFKVILSKGSAKKWSPGLANFVTALVYYFCLALCLQHSRNVGTTFFSQALYMYILQDNNPLHRVVRHLL